MTVSPRALSRAALFTLLFTACLFGASHVAARLAATSGLGAAGQWSRIGAGVAFAMVAAVVFGAALVLAWAPLGQTIAQAQVVGALVVVGVVMALGLRRR